MSDSDEALDTMEPLGNPFSAELIEQIMQAKKGDPSKFASFWEMDEEDVDEATEEEIQNNPATRMLWAAENGKLDVVQELYDQSHDLVHTKDKDGYTPLHRAAYNDHREVAQYLLDHGADIEAKTSDGWTPLHSSSNWGNDEMAALLLKIGANVNAQTKGGQTALHLAAANSESEETLQLLLMHPFVDYSLRNAVGETSQQLARRTCKYHYLFDIADNAVNKLS